MPAFDHRPRSASEIIDAGFALVRRDFPRYALIVAIVMAPWQVVRLAVVRATDFDFSRPDEALADLGPLALVGAVAVLFYAFIEAAVAVAAARAWEGGEPNVRQALATGVRRWVPVLVSMVIKYAVLVLLAIAGMLLGIVIFMAVVLVTKVAPSGESPVMMAFVVLTMLMGALAALPAIGWFAAVPMTAALESLGPIAALRRSRELTRGLWKHAVGVSALAWVIVAVPSLGLGLLASSLGPQIVQRLASIIATLLLTPVYVASLTALYFDLRIRKEGFDLELMASRLAPAAPPLPAADHAGPDLPRSA